MNDDWKSDLLAEKSLKQAYNVSKSLARSDFNRRTFNVVTVLVALVGVFWTLKAQQVVSYEAALTAADVAFDLTVQILGFLIGGFAIFATISDGRLMVRLAQTPMPGSEISVFKTIFYNFISVFYIYVVTLTLGIITKIVTTIKIVNLSSLPCYWNEFSITVINSVVFLILVLSITLSVLRLKSFIWNIYQAYLTLLIAGEVIKEKPKK